jgi:hypothetical protein
VNAELIKNGFALVRNASLDERYKELFLSLQNEAKENRRGLWAYVDPRSESFYVGSKLDRAFHRPQCFHVKNLSFNQTFCKSKGKNRQISGFSQLT